MLKDLNKLGLARKYLNIIKAMYLKSIANVILKIKFTCRMSQGCLLSPLLFIQFSKNFQNYKIFKDQKEVKLSLLPMRGFFSFTLKKYGPGEMIQ